MGLRHGETLGLKWSSATATTVDISFHRVTGSTWTETGSRPSFVPAPHPDAGRHRCARREIPIGSYARAPLPDALHSLPRWSIGALVQPTAKASMSSTIACLSGPNNRLRLRLDDAGYPSIEMDGDLLAKAASPMHRGTWYAAVIAVNDGTIALHISTADDEVETVRAAFHFPHPLHWLHLAAAPAGDAMEAHFDGRIEAPTIATVTGHDLSAAFWRGRAGIDRLKSDRLAAWDFARGIDTQTIVDTGPARLDGTLVNRPTRGVTGAFWCGTQFDWRAQPDAYAAIHFHRDDLDDCGWPDELRIDIPGDWEPGLYVARIENADGVDTIPFAVRSAARARAPRLAFLLPTFTYLSYGNARNAMRGPAFGVASFPDEETLAAHPLGLSQYDLHADRSPVVFSSPLRPLMSFRFGVRPWGLPVDAATLGFLHRLGIDYDMLTDADLHREGVRALEPYDCVVTGNHPEYFSSEMREGVAAFTHRGGRLMYLGGNGFYWRVSVDAATGTIEVRRTENGTRAWIAAPGEGHHAMDGRYGGLWRRLGHPPNEIADIGFAAQGDFDVSGYFVLRAGVRDTAAAFALDGVTGETFGNYGWLGNGAAGQEIDRADPALGTHPDTIVIASSTGHTPAMMRTIEEMLSTVPPFDDPKARADVTFRALPNGGAIFAAGSMTWTAALDHDDGRNDVARITENVLRRFLDPSPFDAESRK